MSDWHNYPVEGGDAGVSGSGKACIFFLILAINACIMLEFVSNCYIWKIELWLNLLNLTTYNGLQVNCRLLEIVFLCRDTEHCG